jgi:hypothetical protein
MATSPNGCERQGDQGYERPQGADPRTDSGDERHVGGNPQSKREDERARENPVTHDASIPVLPYEVED